MGAGAVSAREGAYTTWTIQAIYDTGVALSSSDKLGIRNNGNGYWHDQSEKTVYIISPAAALLATLDGTLIVNDYLRVASLADKYILLAGTWSSLIVQEGLTKLWERDVNIDAAAHDPVFELDPDPPAPIDPGLLAISPSGEWIAAIVKEETTGNGLLFIYKGSSP